MSEIIIVNSNGAYSKNSDLNSNKNSDVRIYDDIHSGRGVPNPEPSWNKDNKNPRSKFGAAWANSNGPTEPSPVKESETYYNISDPYHSREQIKSACKGNRVIYIWTYMPTGICLVGSSSNSVERVLSYFETRYLFFDNRRGVEFLANYGFKNIQLTIIALDPSIYSLKDSRLLEQYYINQLNSVLNVQRIVNIPEKPTLFQDIIETNRDTAKPIIVYGPDLKTVLHIFKSKTSLYHEFNIHHNTLVKFLDSNNELYLDYFYFSTKILPNSDLNNILNLGELLDLRSKAPIKAKVQSIAILVTDTHKSQGDNKLTFNSITSAAKYIKEIVGKSDRVAIQNSCSNKTLYQNRWKIEEKSSSNS
jgi:hypothetical protein